MSAQEWFGIAAFVVWLAILLAFRFLPESPPWLNLSTAATQRRRCLAERERRDVSTNDPLEALKDTNGERNPDAWCARACGDVRFQAFVVVCACGLVREAGKPHAYIAPPGGEP
jgi:hypothetical protein